MSAILSKAQKAIANHLATVDLDPIDETTNIFRGLGNDSVTLPGVVVNAQTADASANYSGNWLVHCSLQVRESADDTTEDEHLAHAATVFNVLLDDGIVAALTAALSDFTAFGFVPTGQSYDLEGRTWISRLEFDLECAPADIT